MKPNQPINRKSTFFRLLRTLFAFFPVLMPVALVCILFSAIVGSLPTVFMQKIIAVIEANFQTGNWAAAGPQILRLVAILGTMYALALVSTVVWTQMMAIITQGLLKKLRVKMFDGMQNLPLRYFDTNDHGDIMSHYTNDIDTLRQMVAQSFPQLLSMIVTIISVLFIMLYYSVWLSLVILLGSLVMVKATRSIGGRSATFFQRQQKSLGKVEGFVEELMDGQKVVKVFCHESETCADFDQLNENLRVITPTFPGVTYTDDEKQKLTAEKLTEDVLDIFHTMYAVKEQENGQEHMREAEKMILLRVVDNRWMEHIDAMSDLKQGIGLRSLGHINPFNAYAAEGFDMFEAMVNEIRQEAVSNCYSVTINTGTARKQILIGGVARKDEFRDEGNGARAAAVAQAMQQATPKPQERRKPETFKRETPKVGRNDPCPCNSGKKYKNCCGKNAVS